MWLITRLGFFSVVQKPEDVQGCTLTVRARVRADLDALRRELLPELGPTLSSRQTDYRFRATAPADKVAAALAQMITSIDYDNFKAKVGATQGTRRSTLYGKVWSVLYQLQSSTKT